MTRAHTSAAPRLSTRGLALQVAAGDGCALVLAHVETLAGRVEVAETSLRAACETCTRLNEAALLASRAAELADALYALGQYDEARSWVEVSQRQSAAEDRHAQASWRGVASRLAARRGETELAAALIDEAITIVGRSDALNLRAKLQLDRAEVLRLVEYDDEARRAIGRAVELYRAKENDVAATTARALLATSALV
jgi:tetratricopeptide (TPR) repeat protein